MARAIAISVTQKNIDDSFAKFSDKIENGMDSGGNLIDLLKSCCPIAMAVKEYKIAYCKVSNVRVRNNFVVFHTKDEVNYGHIFYLDEVGKQFIRDFDDCILSAIEKREPTIKIKPIEVILTEGDNDDN